MKRLVACILMCLALTACGVTQEDHARAQSALEAKYSIKIEKMKFDVVSNYFSLEYTTSSGANCRGRTYPSLNGEFETTFRLFPGSVSCVGKDGVPVKPTE